MTEATLFAFLLLIGGLSLGFAALAFLADVILPAIAMAFLADVILPAIASHRWRRPAATYRRKP